MRIAILTTSYPNFLNELYSHNVGLKDHPYDQQMAARNASLFGFADFYSRGFRAHGHEAREFHLNNPWMQYAWMREQGLPTPSAEFLRSDRTPPPSLLKRLLAPLRPGLGPIARRLRPRRLPEWQATILRAQIEAYQPDIILNQEPAAVRSDFLHGLRKPVRRIVGQIASALPDGEDFRAYDLMISSLPNFVRKFRARGVPAALNKLTFEATIPRTIGEAKRDIPLSFVGNISLDHGKRLVWLEHLARNTPLRIWGSGIEQVPHSSPLHACHQGEAWGRAMYEILGRSRVTLNNHIDLAEDDANNLRLYEATGMGAALLTDAKHNLREIFRPEEVAAYASKEDCVRQIRMLLSDEPRCAAMGNAGQRRTLVDHNYFRRTGEMLEILAGVMKGEARSRWLSVRDALP
jgi:spore maturation protein CgeB